MQSDNEKLRRWRLILGNDADHTMGAELSASDGAMDRALGALYQSDRHGGLGSSAPNAVRWLGDIRQYFPTSVVKVMQKDALERLDMKRMLLEPEFLETVEPDIHLASALISLSSVIPARTRDTARLIVRRVVEEVEKRLKDKTCQAIIGSLNRASRNLRPRYSEIDWPRTIKANLKHYQAEYKTIVPKQLIGYGHKRSSLRDIILCVDQSGSMATSVVYAGILGAVMASLPAVQTRMIVFDTAVVDLTDELQDPVDLLFGTQLGGGTDINSALSYCSSLVQRPEETILVLISDLYEGGDRDDMLKRVAALVLSGVKVITLLALSDEGAPSYDHSIAGEFASMGIPSFACTPDLFPELIATAINRQDIGQWAAANNIVIAGGKS